MKVMSITHCASKKSRPAQILLSGIKQDQKTVFELWNKKIDESTPAIAAQNLYCSRGFKILSNQIKKQSQFFIVSAGLGFINNDTTVPSYDCTIAPGQASSLSSICLEKPNQIMEEQLTY